MGMGGGFGQSLTIRVGKAGRVPKSSLQLQCFVYHCSPLWM